MGDSAQAKTNPKGEVTLGKKIQWLFFLNTLSQQFGIYVTLLFLNMFLTNFVKITPLVVASILTVGRLVDFGVSVVAGGIVQKANLKTGPFRTWILINGPLLTLGIFLIFWNPNISPAAKIVVVIIGYFFRNIPQNFLLAAQNALIQKVGGANIANRLAITAKNAQGISFGGIFTNMITVPLITLLNSVIGNGRGYLFVGVAFGLVQTLGQVIFYLAMKEFDSYDPNLKHVQGSSANVKVTHMYGDTFKNPYIWLLLFANITVQVAMTTLSSLTAYYFTYSLGNMNFMAISRTSMSLLGLGVAFIAPWFVRKAGKRNSVIVSSFGNGLVYLGMALFAGGNFYVYYVLVLAGAVVNGLRGSVGVNLWLDAAEYQLYKTGRDSRPFIMGLTGITMKTGQMISSFTYAAVLTFANFDTATSTLDPQKLVWGMFGLLAVCYGLTGVAYLLFNITDAKSKEYADHNHRVMEEKKAAAAAAAS
jgi:Na+/melibiose symporter-like transporter